jgi:hypothetical protein
MCALQNLQADFLRVRRPSSRQDHPSPPRVATPDNPTRDSNSSPPLPVPAQNAVPCPVRDASTRRGCLDCHVISGSSPLRTLLEPPSAPGLLSLLPPPSTPSSQQRSSSIIPSHHRSSSILPTMAASSPPLFSTMSTPP